MSSAGTIYLRALGGSDQQIRADAGRNGHLHLHPVDANNRRAYMADADITDIVKNALGGTYAVGGASLRTGTQSGGLGNYGGWAIIVIYRDDSEPRSEEHTSELQSRGHLVCRLLLEKKKE